MKSPFTGKEMKRVYEKRTWNFRGEQYEYEHIAWLCEDSGEQFTDDESDMAGFVQVTNQYRAKYGIPYTDEIIAVRQRYGISAAKMSLILGIGVNQYRLYEQGEVPSVSNGRMIRSIMNPKVMLEMVESSKNELSVSEYEKIISKVQTIIASSEVYKREQYETKRIFNTSRGADNGYAQLSLNRLKNIMLYILNRCDEVWCTKMNKLLFYTDFMSYRERGMAMTGLSYRAIDFGPVPERWDRVYSEFPEVRQELRQVGDFVGSVLIASAEADNTMFTDAELKVLDAICTHFGKMTSREISRISHDEEAWLNHHNKHDHIPFDDAYMIKAI
jgi:uncharacterized phage-associated protein/DNA-binding transcriptional regulator YiaG